MADDDSGGLSPTDLDAMARTMVAEARSQDPMGWAAVGSVIRNRLQAGGYGQNPAAIVRAPNQFEVWSNGRAQAVDPNSAAYQGAARMATAIAQGLPDVTEGATHFYSPSGQAAMGRQAPGWARSPTAAIGGQLFYAPNGAVQPQAPAAAIEQSAPQQGTPVSEDPLATLSRYGVKTDDKSLRAPAPAPAAQDQAPGVTFAPGPAAAGASSPSPAAAESPEDTLARYGVKPDVAPAKQLNPNGIAALVTKEVTGQSPAAAPASSPADGAANAAASGFASGVPIVGPSFNSLLDKGVAEIEHLRTGKPYNALLAQIQDKEAADNAAHPIANTAAGVAGGIVSTAPLVAAAPAAFGISGAPLALRAATAAGTSGALGAADAAARGDNPLVGGVLSGAAGAAGPAAGRVIGGSVNALARGLGSGVDGMGRPAVNLLTQALGADGPAAVQGAAARLGPEAGLADLGPSMGGLASGLAVRPGEAKSALFQMLEARGGGANSRINADLDRTFGAAADPQAVTDALRVQRGLQDATNYGQVHAQGAQVDPSGVVAAIDARLPNATGAQRTALQNMRRELVVQDAQPATDTAAAQPAQYRTSSELLHNLRQEVDGAMNYGAPGLGVEGGALSRAQGTLGVVRNALDDALKTQVPGMAEADASSAAMARQMQAVERGTQILGAGKTTQTPQAFAADFARMAPEEQDALRAGVRGEIARLVGTKSNDPAALRAALQGEGGWNTAKLATVFGPGPTQELVDAVGREGTFGETMNRVVGNSQTAQRSAAAALLKDTDPQRVDLKSASALGLAAHYGKRALVDPAVNYLLTPNNAPRDAQLGRAFAMQGGQRDQLVNQLVAAASRQGGATVAGQRADAMTTALANPLVRAYLARQQQPRGQ